jgi:hypothetical protein
MKVVVPAAWQMKVAEIVLVAATLSASSVTVTDVEATVTTSPLIGETVAAPVKKMPTAAFVEVRTAELGLAEGWSSL